MLRHRVPRKSTHFLPGSAMFAARMFRVSRQYILLRTGAFLVDALLISLLLILPASLLSWIVIRSGGAMNWIARIWNITFVLFLLGLLVRDSRSGRSIGKLVMGLDLKRKDETRPGLGSSIVRNLPLIIPVLNVVEVFVALFSERGRRIGDRLAGTVVVEE